MDELLRLLAASLNQKGALSASDLSLLFDPEVGILSGTYTPPTVLEEGVQNPEQYIPTFAQIEQFEQPDSLRRTIADAVRAGTPIWEIEKQILSQAQAEMQAGLTPEDTTDNYIALAKTLQNEWQSYSNAAAKAKGKVSDSPFAKYGLPEPDMQFDVSAMIQPQLEMLARKYQQAVREKTRNVSVGRPSAVAGGYVPPVGTQPSPERAGAAEAPKGLGGTLAAAGLGSLLFGPSGVALTNMLTRSGEQTSRRGRGAGVTLPERELPPTQQRAGEIVKEKLVREARAKQGPVSAEEKTGITGSYLGKRLEAEKGIRADLQEKYARAAAATQRLQEQAQARYGVSPLEQALMQRAAFILQAGK